MRRLIKYTSIGAGASLLSMTAFSYYNFEQTRNSPKEMIKIVSRMTRSFTSGGQIALQYLLNPEDYPKNHEICSKILYNLFLQNQGTYIKLGQLLATLDILIPEAYSNELIKLCEHTYYSEFPEIEILFKKEMKCSIEDIFSSFEKIPIKSASIAQVHRAVLKNGQKVAVKIQHPGLQEQVQGDINVMSLMVDVGEYFFPEFKYSWWVEEVQINLPQELNFLNEIENQKRCQRNFKDNDRIKVKQIKQVPDVYDQFCSSKIITMEFIDGISLTNKQALIDNKFNLKEVCYLLSSCFCKQIYDHGFVHGDPHQVKLQNQGNIFVQRAMVKNKEVTQLVLLDHGIYKTLTPKTQYYYAKLWKGILTQNENAMFEASEHLGAASNAKLFVAMITSKPYERLMDKTQKDVKKRMKKFDTEEERKELFDMAQERHCEITKLLQVIDRDLLLILKVNEYLYAIDKTMGSPINTYENTVPFQCQMNHCFFILEKNVLKNSRTIQQKLQLKLEKYMFRIYTFFYKLFVIY